MRQNYWEIPNPTSSHNSSHLLDKAPHSQKQSPKNFYRKFIGFFIIVITLVEIGVFTHLYSIVPRMPENIPYRATQTEATKKAEEILDAHKTNYPIAITNWVMVYTTLDYHYKRIAQPTSYDSKRPLESRISNFNSQLWRLYKKPLTVITIIFSGCFIMFMGGLIYLTRFPKFLGFALVLTGAVVASPLLIDTFTWIWNDLHFFIGAFPLGIAFIGLFGAKKDRVQRRRIPGFDPNKPI